MAKKLSMVSVLLSVAVVLALVYFFRPQTFSFLVEGFDDDMFDPDSEGFKGAAGKKDTTTASPPPPPPTKTVKCAPGCVP